MRALHHSLVVSVMALSACDEAAGLDVSFGSGQYAPPVQVDTRCDNGGCETPAYLEVEVSIGGEPRADAVVEILQYRVDYDLAGVGEEVPFFAAATILTVSAGTPATFNVLAAGDRQRDWILTEFGYESLEGTAKLTLAGYDQDDEVIMADARFDIGFGDFQDDSGAEGEDGGTP